MKLEIFSYSDAFTRFHVTLGDRSFCGLGKTVDKYARELGELNFAKFEGPKSANLNAQVELSDCPSPLSD